ncbi:MAG TPA: hypothetical protein VK601_11475, partial [Kofleriaceae bacterium]|nr:hypothetical protein [Kofleriaceae bacterium]
MLRTPAVVLALVLALVAAVPGAVPGAAHANPAGDVTTRHAPGSADDVRFGAEYELEIDSAAISREHTGDAGAEPLAPQIPRRELEFHRTRHVVTPAAELGIYRDVWISVAAPIVLAESSEIDLAAGVDRATASTFTDGILPVAGFDARNPGRAPSGNLVFHGVTRSGVSELRTGLGYAPMSQARDDTAPTWKLGAELGFAVGRIMRFDAVAPDRETGVSSGVHQLRLWTSFDRRLRYFEGWLEASY